MAPSRSPSLRLSARRALFAAAALALLAATPACDKLKEMARKAESGDKDEAPAAPAPAPIVAPAVPAALFVRNAELSIIAVKDGDTEVAATFTGLTGEATFDDGARPAGLHGTLTIPIAGFSSGKEERDHNVEEVFFDQSLFPTATFTLTALDGLPEEGVAIGYDAPATAKGNLVVHGTSTPVEAKVKLTRSGEKEYHLDSTEPVFLSIEAMALTERLKSLMTTCGHKSVDNNVRLTLRLDLGPTAPAPVPAPAPAAAPPPPPAKVPHLPPIPTKTREPAKVRLPKVPPSQQGSHR